MDAVAALISRLSPAKLAEPAPDAAALEQILQAAVRAPDHGKLKPWRFILIRGEARDRLGDVMADCLRRSQPDAPDALLDAERRKPLRAPLIVVLAAATRAHPKIPQVEQLVAVGAAAQNALVAAHALGYGCLWKTGAAAYDDQVKAALGLDVQDQIVGFLYLGSVAQPGLAKPAVLDGVVREWSAPVSGGAAG